MIRRRLIQKNNHVVEKHAFYWCYGTAVELELLNQLWLLVSARLDFFTPTKKPVGHTTTDGHQQRIYYQPQLNKRKPSHSKYVRHQIILRAHFLVRHLGCLESLGVRFDARLGQVDTDDACWCRGGRAPAESVGMSLVSDPLSAASIALMYTPCCASSYSGVKGNRQRAPGEAVPPWPAWLWS